MYETCPECDSDSGHYSADSCTAGQEIWVCDRCGHVYIVFIKEK